MDMVARCSMTVYLLFQRLIKVMLLAALGLFVVLLLLAWGIEQLWRYLH